MFYIGFFVKLHSHTMSAQIPHYRETILLGMLFYSIAEGISIGIISYVVINLACKKWREISPIMYVLAVLFILKYIFL